MLSKLKAVVLAAGKGTRLNSNDVDAPKVMRLANEKPLLWYVLEAISFVEKKDTIIVVGYKKENVIEYFDGYEYAYQQEQLGTGHAVMAAGEWLKQHKGAVLLCYGDMPAIRREIYDLLVNTHYQQANNCTLLTGLSDLSMSFGRIIRDENGSFTQVVEEKDCTPDQLKIKELNTGVYVFDTQWLLRGLAELTNDNAQREYYVTDVPAIMKQHGAKIGLCMCNLGDDMIGVNTLEQLNMVERILKER